MEAANSSRFTFQRHWHPAVTLPCSDVPAASLAVILFSELEMKKQFYLIKLLQY